MWVNYALHTKKFVIYGCDKPLKSLITSMFLFQNNVCDKGIFYTRKRGTRQDFVLTSLQQNESVVVIVVVVTTTWREREEKGVRWPRPDDLDRQAFCCSWIDRVESPLVLGACPAPPILYYTSIPSRHPVASHQDFPEMETAAADER